MVVFVLFKHLELLVEIALQLKDYFFEQLDLCAFALVAVKVVWLVYHLEDVLTFDCGSKLVDGALSLNDLPVDFFHSLYILLVALVHESCESSLLLRVYLSCLGTQFTLSDHQNRLEFAIGIVLVRVKVVHLVVFLLQLAGTGLFEFFCGLCN